MLCLRYVAPYYLNVIKYRVRRIKYCACILKISFLCIFHIITISLIHQQNHAWCILRSVIKCCNSLEKAKRVLPEDGTIRAETCRKVLIIINVCYCVCGFCWCIKDMVTIVHFCRRFRRDDFTCSTWNFTQSKALSVKKWEWKSVLLP